MVDSNTEAQRPENLELKKIRKRATIVGRIFLATLVLVLVLELHARHFYGKSLEAVREAVAKHREVSGDGNLPLTEVEPLIKGFPRHRDQFHLHKPVRLVSYPSLFRTYVLRFELTEDRNIDVLATGEWEAGRYTDEPVTIGQQLEGRGYDIPRKPGYVRASGDIVQLGFVNKRRPRRFYGFAPNLYRELFRQAFLIAARDELQLRTRDVNIGEELLMIKYPDKDTEPFQLRVAIRPKRAGFVLYFGRGTSDLIEDLEELSIELPADVSVEDVVSEAEKLSRTTFVEWLNNLNIAGQANSIVESGDIPEDAKSSGAILNTVSQLATLRSVHQSIRSDGESPERLVTLSRAYANLGELTDHFLAPLPEAFRARALLYAERLVQRSPDSALAHAGRARVRTLSGLHAAALTDIDRVKELESESEGSKPSANYSDWLGIVEASARGDLDTLRKQTETDGINATVSLAALLHLQHAAASGDRPTITLAANRMLALEPSQALAFDRLISNTPDGSEQQRLRDISAASAQMIAENCRRLTGLTESLEKLIDQIPETMEECAAWRNSLYDEFKTYNEQVADGKVADAGEPALETAAALLRQSALLQDIRFLNHYHQVRDYTPDITEAWTDLTGSWSDPRGHHYFNRNFTDFINSSTPINSPGDRRIRDRFKLYKSTVPMFSDLAWLVRTTPDGDAKKDAARRLLKVSPHSDTAVQAAVNADWATIKDRVAEWEDRFAESSVIQAELGEAYFDSMRYEDAERCLIRSLKLRQDRGVARLLAECYLEQGQDDLWLAEMERASQLETSTLFSERMGTYIVMEVIARELLRQGKPQQALPYAEKAASSGAAWGFNVAAACHDALGDFAKAEVYIKMRAEQHGLPLDWYFWCHRTGRGDLAVAKRAVAGRTLIELQTSKDVRTCAKYFIYCMLNDDPKSGIMSLAPAAMKSSTVEGPWAELHLEQASYDLGEFIPGGAEISHSDKPVPFSHEKMSKERMRRTVQCLFYCIEANVPTEPAPFFVELRKHVLDQDKKPLNLQRMDWIVRTYGSAGSRTNMWYFIGKVLLREGQKDDAVQYFKLAASSPYSHKYNAILAGHELTKLGIEVAPVRPAEYETGEAKLVRMYNKAAAFWGVNEPDRAIMRFEKILELDPDWAPAHFYLGGLKGVQGNKEEALRHYNEAIRLEPYQPDLRVARGRTFEATGNVEQAIADYEKALELDSRYDDANWSLGMIRAASPVDKLRDGQAAVKHAEAVDVYGLGQDYDRYQLLAAAHAETGDFKAAVEFARKSSYKSSGGYEAHQQLVADYEAGKPYRLKVKVNDAEND